LNNFASLCEQAGIPARVLLVEQLAEIVANLFPDLWKLGQAYFSGELQIRPGPGRPQDFKVTKRREPIRLSGALAPNRCLVLRIAISFFVSVMSSKANESLKLFSAPRVGGNNVILRFASSSLGAAHIGSHPGFRKGNLRSLAFQGTREPHPMASPLPALFTDHLLDSYSP